MRNTRERAAYLHKIHHSLNNARALNTHTHTHTYAYAHTHVHTHSRAYMHTNTHYTPQTCIYMLTNIHIAHLEMPKRQSKAARVYKYKFSYCFRFTHYSFFKFESN